MRGEISMAIRMVLLAAMVTAGAVQAQQYEPTWESLKNYEAPEWYEDAKLGFWVHWGVYSVPAYMGEHAAEWYGRHMYNPKGPGHFQHHMRTYGDQSEFGYKDFVPMFKAENFDADEWADLCVQGGAQFFTMMGAHHDSFCLWDSTLSKWNSVNMGPKRDLTGEIAEAIRKRGLKFGVSNHTAWNYEFFAFNHLNGFDAKDPANRDLYGTPVIDSEGGRQPSERDVSRWLERTKELCDLYQPDLYYFDWGHGNKLFDPGNREFAAHYYNKAMTWGLGTYGRPGVVLNYKHNIFAPGSAVNDVERGGKRSVQKIVWQTDDCVYAGHTWGYSEGVPIKATDQIVDTLMDIISKRGVLMLSFAPKADGTWPEDQQQMIRDLGAWLRINGEAVYATRPWEVHGEGPTAFEAVPYGKRFNYTAEDIRYTRNKANDTLYATMLSWDDTVRLKLLKKGTLDTDDIELIQLLGSDETCTWKQTEDGLIITMSAEPDYHYAYPIKIKLKGQLPTALTDMPLKQGETISVSGQSVDLPVEKAWLFGSAIKLERKGNRSRNVGHWSDEGDYVQWVLNVKEPGTYRVVATAAAPSDTHLSVSCNGSILEGKLVSTGAWDNPKEQSLGEISIEQAGTHKLTASPAKRSDWQPTNVWSLTLIPVH